VQILFPIQTKEKSACSYCTQTAILCPCTHGKPNVANEVVIRCRASFVLVYGRIPYSAMFIVHCINDVLWLKNHRYYLLLREAKTNYMC